MPFGHCLFAEHLASYLALTQGDCKLLEDAASRNVKSLGPRRDLVVEGDPPDSVKVVLEGWVARYKQLRDGRRQILSLLIPGDISDWNVFVLDRMDHSLGSLTPVRYAEIGQAEYEALTSASPRIAKALSWSELVELSIQREWTTNIGQRNAYERLAHLLCEIFWRAQVRGLANGDTCDCPLTQTDLADATGLTPVHVNRTLQHLRGDGLVELRARRLKIVNAKGLQAAGMFTPGYLHNAAPPIAA